MITQEQFFPINQLNDAVRQKNKLYVNDLFPKRAMIRAGDLQLMVVSRDNASNLVTLKLAGIFLQPKEDPKEPSKIIQLNNPIIKP